MARPSPGSTAPPVDLMARPEELTLGGVKRTNATRTNSTTARLGETADFIRPEVEALQSIWQQSREAYIGTRALHANVSAYVSPHPKELAADYQRRSQFAEFYNAYGRTIRAVVGQPFSKPGKLGDNVHADVQDDCENIDGRGTHLDVFLQQWFFESITAGCGGVLCDAPRTPEGMTKADEDEHFVRPFWVRYQPEDIINWRFATIKGRRVLVLLVLRETVEEPVTEFGCEMTTTYRVYRRSAQAQDASGGTVTVETYRETVNARGKIEVLSEGPPVALRNMTRIPFHGLTLGLETSEMTALPALLDLLDSNLAHFRVSTDRRYLMHLGCVPIPVRKGFKPPLERQGESRRSMGFGINTLMDVPADGDFWWAEITGAAFAPTGEELRQIEQHMAALGLAFLAAETRGAETAEAKRIDSAAQNATLASCVRKLDDGTEMLLSFHAEFRGVAAVTASGELSGGEFSTSREYEAMLMDAPTMAVYTAMNTAGQLTLETLWAILENGGRLLPGFKAEKEKAQLLLDAPPVMLALPPGDPEADPEEEAATEAEDGEASNSAKESKEDAEPPKNKARTAARITARKKPPVAAAA